MGPMMRIRAHAMVIVAGAVLCGCSSSGTSSHSSAGATQGIATGPAGSADQRVEWVESPLHAYLGTGAEGTGPSEAQLTRERKRQELIAVCMAAEGFDYSQRTPEEAFGEAMEWLPSNRDWVAKYGYQRTTIDEVPVASPRKPDDVNDARNKALAGMSQSQRQAYGNAEKKCETDIADQLQQQEKGASVDMSAFGGLRQDINAMRNRILIDTRLLEAAQRWSHCVADTGYPGLENPDDAATQIDSQLIALGAQDAPGSEYRGPLPKVRTIEELKKVELALAVADFDCKDSTGYRKIETDVRLEYENKFVADHKAELERYHDALTASGG